MKKIFTLIAGLAMTAGAFATDYTDTLIVTVNGVSTGQRATISLEQNTDGTYNFSLKNFILQSEGAVMPVGNINLDNVQGVTQNGVTTLNVDRDITIANGDASASPYWLGEMLGVVPVRMVAEQRDNSLYTIINIEMASLGQTIKVTFGNGGYQLPNSGFEDFYTNAVAKNVGGAIVNIDEPLHWHGFASSTGGFSAFVKDTPHSFQSSEVRPGSTGSKSVCVKATSVFTVVANGTITTGRMSAGSMQADNTDNHAELDMSKTDVDGNGDPFYVTLNGQPDSLAVWVKFNQGTAVASHPYATVSAIITDGTYYQDPQDKEYTNKLAEARDTKIAATGSEWRRLAIPFNYIDRTVNGKAILITISTNADPGRGSAGDSILVDDISLIYNAPSATAITVKGNAVEGFADGQTVTLANGYGSITADDITVATDNDNAKVFKALEQGDDSATVTIKVASNDLNSIKTYTLIVPNTATGVRAVSVDDVRAETAPAEIYNVSGQRVTSMQPGQVYVVKKNGKAVKVLK